MSDHRPARLITCEAYAVFSPDGRLETAKSRQADAVAAARIIGGSDWEVTGYTVEPVTVSRFKARD